MVTIGVAVAIPEPWATQLQDYRTSVGDTTATQIPTHITLIPPVEVPADDLPAVEAHLERAASGVQEFRIHLRGTGTFRPVSPVVFVTLVEGISQCELLADAVRRGPLAVDLHFPYHPHVTIAHHLADAVRRGPLAVDLHFPYHPHVTIAHHLADAQLDRAFGELADFECEFTAGAFSLYVHDEGAGWQPTREFALQPLA